MVEGAIGGRARILGKVGGLMAMVAMKALERILGGGINPMVEGDCREPARISAKGGIEIAKAIYRVRVRILVKDGNMSLMIRGSSGIGDAIQECEPLEAHLSAFKPGINSSPINRLRCWNQAQIRSDHPLPLNL